MNFSAARIFAAHCIELDELDDAILRDQFNPNIIHGLGEVIWSSPTAPLLAVAAIEVRFRQQ
jgi:hypothetical protein